MKCHKIVEGELYIFGLELLGAKAIKEAQPATCFSLSMKGKYIAFPASHLGKTPLGHHLEYLDLCTKGGVMGAVLQCEQ